MVQLLKPACYRGPSSVIHVAWKEFKRGFGFSCHWKAKKCFWKRCLLSTLTVALLVAVNYPPRVSSWIIQTTQCIHCVRVCVHACPPVLAVCSLLIWRCSDRLSSIAPYSSVKVLQLAKQSVLCTLWREEKIKLWVLKLQCRHVIRSVGLLLYCTSPTVRSITFTDVQNVCFDVSTKLPLVWNAACTRNIIRWCHLFSLKPVF